MMNLNRNKLKPARWVGVRSAIALALGALAGWAAAGCSSSERLPGGDPVTPSMPPGQANYSTNLLQEGDVVSITFQYSTNFNAVQKITLDGTLNLESIGTVKAAGKTPLALQDELAGRYKSQIKDDVVTVKLVSSTAGVYVCGAVFHPGKVPLERPLTALEAIMEAGGFDPNRADLADVSVLRIEGGIQQTYHVNLKKVFQGKSKKPFYLRPFDIVNVPSKTFNF